LGGEVDISSGSSGFRDEKTPSDSRCTMRWEIMRWCRWIFLVLLKVLAQSLNVRIGDHTDPVEEVVIHFGPIVGYELFQSQLTRSKEMGSRMKTYITELFGGLFKALIRQSSQQKYDLSLDD
jgi:hypothetical protein